jgi:hypothetical protein
MARRLSTMHRRGKQIDQHLVFFDEGVTGHCTEEF